MTHSRRRARPLVAFVLSAALLTGLLVSCSPEAQAQPRASASCDAARCGDPVPRTLEEMRVAWSDVLTGGDSYDPEVEPYRTSINRIDGVARVQWSGLKLPEGGEPWADINTNTMVDLMEAFTRVRYMAQAWATHGSQYEGDPLLLHDIVGTLTWLHDNRYNARTTYVPVSWWYWEIGIPLELNDITVMLYDSLAPEQVDGFMDAIHHFSPTVTRTGANRIWASMVVGLRGVIIGDEEAVRLASDGVVPALDYVTSGDGFYRDGSFVQHNTFAYTGGYGLSMLRTLAKFLMLVRHSPYTVTDASIANVANWVSKSFDPVIYNGAVMDAVRGREISRDYMQDHDAGVTAMRAVLMLAESSPPEVGVQLRSIAKRWLVSDALGDYWKSGSIFDLTLGGAALADTELELAPAPLGAWMFNGMGRAVAQSDNFAFSVSMSSSRIADFELVSGQNLRGWYTAAGMTALYTNDTTQYSDDYWATVNPYRLAGTTVDTIPRAGGQGSHRLSDSTFAGGVASSSGRYGASGMKLTSYLTSTRANKAWFFFDDEVVALGSGVSSEDQTGTGWDGSSRHVETIVDTRKIEATQRLTVNGVNVSDQRTFSSASWAHVSGDVGQVGYVFPGGAPVVADRYVGTGAWSDINTARGSDAVSSNDFASLWFNHGSNPKNATYSYVVLPDASEAHVRDYAKSPDVTVLENSTRVSAVEESTLNVVGAVFWAGGTVDRNGLPYLTSDTRATVMTEGSRYGLAVTISDPTMVNDAVATVEIMRTAESASYLSPGVTVVQLSPSIILTVDLAAAAGEAFQADFRYAQVPAV